MDIDRGGTIVHLGPFLDDGGRAATRAWVELEAGSAFAADLPAADVDALLASLPRPLPPEALACLGRVGPARLAGDERGVELRFGEVERDPARLAAAVQLAALARPPALAPYR